MVQASAAPVRLIVGLGNPGGQYDRTRHNVGFDIVESLSRRWFIPIAESKRFKGYYGEGTAVAGRKVSLLKPTTFMNRSGQAVRSVLDWYKVDAGSVLVIYDDMDLPTGRLRLRLSGSAGGHNGMKSIISHLGTQEFPRLRVGIGETQKDGDRNQAVVSHVLGKFSPEEQKLMEKTIDWAMEAAETSLRDGVESAMNIFNSRKLVP